MKTSRIFKPITFFNNSLIPVEVYLKLTEIICKDQWTDSLQFTATTDPILQVPLCNTMNSWIPLWASETNEDLVNVIRWQVRLPHLSGSCRAPDYSYGQNALIDSLNREGVQEPQEFPVSILHFVV